jgi:carbon storage regulator
VLILRRRAGEAIVVGGEVEIEIIEISKTRVKLGVTAPRNVPVMRREALAAAGENRIAAAFLRDTGISPELIRLVAEAAARLSQNGAAKADM